MRNGLGNGMVFKVSRTEFKTRVDKQTWLELRHELGYPNCKDREISIIVGRNFLGLRKVNKILYGKNFGKKNVNVNGV